MRIVIAGGSGFLGTALSARLAKDGHAVVTLTRNATEARSPGLVRYAEWTPNGDTGPWAREIDGADAVINLAGAGLADKRWTAARKRVLRDSRVNSARSLLGAMRAASRAPSVFMQASGVGYYGAFIDGPELDETASPGDDFLASLCVAWEAEAQPATAMGCRVIWLRSAVVLSLHGGALPKMLLPFRLLVGGPLGSGSQYLTWIHLDDWTGMVTWALNNPSVAGPLNVSAPHPVTNADFSAAVGRAIHRPHWIAVPPLALRLVVAEMASIPLLT